MKFRLSTLFLIAILSLLSACSSNDSNDSSGSKVTEGKINAITSFYPLYDFTQQIGGEHVNAINLIPTGIEPHDWSPKSEDIKNITQADLLIYNGLGFEGWIGDLEKLAESSLRMVNTSEGIDLIHVSEDGGHEEEGHGEHEDQEFDPHIWLSPISAMKIAENIKNALVETDPVNQADYETNYDYLINQLTQVSEKFEKITSDAERKDIVVSHDAYGYMARDYGLNQVPIMGLSPEAEPTAQDIAEISRFVKENDIKYILYEELVSPKMAETLAKDLAIEPLVFNPVEGLTEEHEKAGEDYISLMTKNAESLQKALN